MSYSRPPNILLIIVDDLKPSLGSYGDEAALSPNLDLLASQGTIFSRTYAQQAVCGPSRTSFLTSRRPDTTRLYDFHSYWRTHAGNFTSLPQYFREQGYLTAGMGKVFHPGIASNHSDDQPYSWSLPPYHPPSQKWKDAAVCPDSNGRLHSNLFCPIEVSEQPGSSLPDLETVEQARSFLTKSRRQPFLLAVGLHKPHVPHKFPRQFLDFHPLSSVRLPTNMAVPPGLPSVAWAPWWSIRRREDVASSHPPLPWGPLDVGMARLVKQGYYSAVTYIDQQVGRLLEMVDNNTLVLVTSDHGWSLGEHGEWAKFSNYEETTRVPLILALPGSLTNFTPVDVEKESQEWRSCENSVHTDCRAKLLERHRKRPGTEVTSLVELVDLFPSLVDLAEFPPLPTCPQPSTHVLLCTEGRSWRPLISQTREEISSKPALSQYPRPSIHPTNTSDLPRESSIKYMGYSVRLPRFRCTLWMGFSALPYPTPHPDQIVGAELYDHTKDPGENHNLIGGTDVVSQEELLLCLNSIQEEFLDKLGINDSVPIMLSQVQSLLII